VPLSEHVRRRADIMAMAAAWTLHGDQAGPTLRNNQADLTAGGREFLNNPNGSTDAALKPAWGGVVKRT
jgi:2,4-dienoyl-CoA reductase-like NADH-dependent reductase (Old Yellow Enzyme family)